MKTHRLFLFFSVLSLLFVTCSVVASVVALKDKNPLQVTQVLPAGEDVLSERQVTIQFNQPIEPIGEMAREAADIPVKITPEVHCQWRWLDRSTLACELNQKEALRKATEYSVDVYSGFKSESGVTLNQSYHHTFMTERPKILSVQFVKWKSPGEPIIRIIFNQPVEKGSIERNIYMEYKKWSGMKRVALHVSKDSSEKYSIPYSLKEKGIQEAETETARCVWLVYPKKSLPLNVGVRLKVQPGVLSVYGKERGVQKESLSDFNTLPVFDFLGVKCRTNNNKEIVVDGRQGLGERCSPDGEIGLVFSSPVLASEIKKQMRLTAGSKDTAKLVKWKSLILYPSDYIGKHKRGKSYSVWINGLKASKEYRLQTNQIRLNVYARVKAWFKRTYPSLLRDQFGRMLSRSIDFSFQTDEYRPSFDISKRAILEKQTNLDSPIRLLNIDKVTLDYNQLTGEERKENQSVSFRISKKKDRYDVFPLGIKQILKGRSGVVCGTVSTHPKVSQYNKGEKHFFAEVTPYQVHVKMGHFNTVVWVTDLATGQPITGAHISIYKDRVSHLSNIYKVLSQSKTNKQGVGVLKGMQDLDALRKTFSWSCKDQEGKWSQDCERLMVRVEQGKEMVLVPLESSFEVNTYRTSNHTVWSYPREKYGHIRAWGTTAQGVYRAGEVIQYKIYVRNQNNQTYIPAPKGVYHLAVIDSMGKVVHEVKDISLSKFGSAHGEYVVSKNAAMGWYRFKLTSDFTKQSWQPMRVFVSDFTPSSFKVTNSLNGKVFRPEDKVEVFSKVTLHSGGTYTDATARITATLEKKEFISSYPPTADFVFDRYQSFYPKTLFQKPVLLGEKGQAMTSFTLPKEEIVYGTIEVESSVQDDRGKSIASRSFANYIGVDRLVGLKNSKWINKAEKSAKIQYVVIDDQGRPVSGVNVKIKVEREEIKTVHVKGAANAYWARYVKEWLPFDSFEGVSESGIASFQFTPKQSGQYRAIATIRDTEGRKHSSELSVWVVGKDQVVWDQPNDHSLSIMPEKSSYQVGESARYLVKNPYPNAIALITIERNGVLKSWTKKLEQSVQPIEFEIEEDFIPGFYLSIVVASPRVSPPPKQFASVDLGKPSFKMGYVKVPVKDAYKAMSVLVQTDLKTYKPRDTVQATITAQLKHQEKKEPVEIAVAVVDEAVFDLVAGGKSYFDPYDGFYHLEDLDMTNYNLITHLIGKESFEKKGANSGGGGGAEISLRSLFDFVAYWNPSIQTNKNGRAKIQFTLPDNLTGWRILALAVTPSDRMGLGEATFKVNRSIEIQPVMPNQVLEGDTFQAGFNIMNRTDKPSEIKIGIQATGTVESVSSFEKVILLQPYQRETLFMPIKVGDVSGKLGQIDFSATASSALHSDGLKHTLKVSKRYSLETVSQNESTTENKITETLLFPESIRSDMGGLSVILSPSVIGEIFGAFQYMKEYPYTCWEQKLSRAVMAAYYKKLNAYLPEEAVWQESDHILQEVLKHAADYQAPNGGMAYFVSSNQHVDLYLSVYTAWAFNELRSAGYEIPQSVEDKLHGYLQPVLKKEYHTNRYSNEMNATIRAIVLAALSQDKKIDLNDLERHHSHLSSMSLFGKACYLQAALQIKGADRIVEKTIDSILAQASRRSSGGMWFEERVSDDYSYILSTPLRSNCAVLSALTEYIKNYQAEKEKIKKLESFPIKLVRSISEARDGRSYWSNTQENTFCAKALSDYAALYEKIDPNMSVQVRLNEQSIGEATFDNFKKSAHFVRPMVKQDLGKKSELNITREGEGRLYYSAQMSYAPLSDHSFRMNAGIDIRKEYQVKRDGKWIVLSDSSVVKKGELVRVDITLSLPKTSYFVVVNDPIPGGLEPVNRDLANVSTVDAGQEGCEKQSSWRFYHRELKNDVVRFYSDYIPEGEYCLSYMAQAIAEGTFKKMPISAEEMYHPDVFGKGLSGTLEVKGER